MPSSLRAVKRTGLSRLEAVVACSIFSIIVVLLIHWILKARESARQDVCRYNMKQIGQALHNYHDAMSMFPPGFVFSPVDGPRSGWNGFGWQALTLPYIDASPLYNKLNFSVSIWDSENRPVHLLSYSQFYPTYLCPSSDTKDEPLAIKGELLEPLTLGRSHYVGNAGQVRPWNAAMPSSDWSDVATGILFRNSSTSIKDIEAGMTNTVFVGEASAGADRTWVGVIPRTRNCLPSEGKGEVAPDCDDAATFVLFTSGTAEDGGVFVPAAESVRVNQLSSAHPSGSLLLMADGAVRMVHWGLDSQLWSWLCDRRRKKPSKDWDLSL